ncbi:MAG: DNA topoisomerase IB, partial [Solirubrobacteraceae bacterium]
MDEDGRGIEDPQLVGRIRDLSIPPAWTDVWICRDPWGHLQATGSDAAGRKQYLYHELWRGRRDREKFERMLRFARALPRLRRRVGSDLRGSDPSRSRVLACAARLLELGLFRIGGEEYAENGGGLGLATLQRTHVEFENGSIVFDYPAKGGVRRVCAIDDRACAALLQA